MLLYPSELHFVHTLYAWLSDLIAPVKLSACSLTLTYSVLHHAGRFLYSLAAVLHPEHGTFMMNLHGGRMPNPLVQMAHQASGNAMAGAGFDKDTRDGRNVLRCALMFR